MTTYLCSCCAARFESTEAEQARYDVDAGYGYCDSCLKWPPLIKQIRDREALILADTIAQQTADNRLSMLTQMASSVSRIGEMDSNLAAAKGLKP